MWCQFPACVSVPDWYTAFKQAADFTVWLDTIKEGRYEDTNQLFERPTNVEIRIAEWNEKNHHEVAEEVLRLRGRNV